MTPVLTWVIISFVIALTVSVIILTIFIVNLINEAILTMKNIKDITDTTKKELEPALKSVNNVLSTAGNLSILANKQLDITKNIIAAVIGASYFAYSKAKSGGFIKGLLSGFNLFKKKGDKNVIR